MKIGIASLRGKIVALVSIFVIFSFFVLFSLITRELNKEMRLSNLESISQSRKAFDSFVSEETRVLKMGLMNALENDEIKNIFIQKDREKLYAYVKPIFDAQKFELGVTHWLFHEPDQNVFLRVHSPNLFGMPAQERKTFTEAKESKSWGIGMELGSVGFAQRVVHPYYRDNELIGYMEYGEDIAPILDGMKKQTGNDFAILGQKASIDLVRWRSFRESIGLQNNYDDLQDYVILGATDEKIIGAKNRCFAEQVFKDIPREGAVFDEFEFNKKNYVCGGFALLGDEGETIGVVVAIIDATSEIADASNKKYFILTLTSIVFIVISFILVVLINRIIISPLKKLADVANGINEKNLGDKIKIESNDEFGAMAIAFNQMNERLRDSYKMLEEKIRQKTMELTNIVEDMKKRNSNLENSKSAMLNILEDFGESKKMIEQEKNRYEAERDRSAGILRYLHSIGEGIIATDTNGKLIFINLTAAKLVMYSEGSSLVGRSYLDKFSFVLGRGSSAKSIDPVAMVLKRPFIYVLPPNCYLLSENRKIPVSGSFAPIIQDGEILGVVSVFQDITERYNLEKEKDEFISIAAHQLRTPLTGIRWTIESLIDGDAGKITKETKRMLTQVFDNNQRLIVLVNDLLDVSRINMGKSKEELTRVNICNVLQEAVAALNGLAKERKVEISFEKVRAINPFVMTGPKHIFQAIENILSNSIKYTPIGGIIKTAVDYRKDKVVISISDNGIGIPEKDQERIFSKFFRASNAVLKETEGSGLGLNVVKSFIEEAGGKIWFKSGEGKGTTFFIELPVA